MHMIDLFLILSDMYVLLNCFLSLLSRGFVGSSLDALGKPDRDAYQGVSVFFLRPVEASLCCVRISSLFSSLVCMLVIATVI
jgi:hypothetical protein